MPIDLAGGGVCKSAGAAAAGDPCTDHAIDTGCAAGLLCVGDDPAGGSASLCRPTCDFWGGAGALCPGGGLCHPSGACVVTATPDGALFGEPCAAGAAAGTFCQGDSSGALAGVCDDASVCRRLCRLTGSAQDCEAGSTCEDLFGAEVGACTVTGGGGGPGPGGVTWTDDIQPIMQTYCAGCHGFASSYTSMKSMASAALGKMQSGSMPPGCQSHGAGCPTTDEIAALQAWLDAGTPQ